MVVAVQTASSTELLLRCGRALEKAVRGKEVERVGPGRYALPQLPLALKVGAALRGVVSHESAAQYWCLESSCHSCGSIRTG